MSDEGTAAERISVKEVIEETLINLERLEGEFERLKRRLLKLLELSKDSDL